MTKNILERLSEGVVLGDGGYLLELERRGYVQAGPFVPEVSLTRPEALAELHREFVRAGVDVIRRSPSTRARTSSRPSASTAESTT